MNLSLGMRKMQRPFDILINRTAKGNVDDLDAPANAEHRLFRRCKGPAQPDLHAVSLLIIDGAALGIRFSKPLGIHIPAAT